eukprot:144555-Pyramimonas_sp.AAC.1
MAGGQHFSALTPTHRFWVALFAARVHKGVGCDRETRAPDIRRATCRIRLPRRTSGVPVSVKRAVIDRERLWFNASEKCDAPPRPLCQCQTGSRLMPGDCDRFVSATSAGRGV